VRDDDTLAIIFWQTKILWYSRGVIIKDDEAHSMTAPKGKSRTDQMVARLREMQISTPDIEASAVVSVDGLIMASSLPGGIEEDRVAAMSAAMLSLGERIATELGRKELEQVYIHGDKGHVFVIAVGQEAVLTVLCREQAKTGMVLLDMKRAVAELAKLV